MGLVLVSEVLNAVAKTLVDSVSPGYRLLAGVVKDVTAGAAVLAAIVAAIVGLLVLGPSLWSALTGA